MARVAGVRVWVAGVPLRQRMGGCVSAWSCVGILQSVGPRGKRNLGLWLSCPTQGPTLDKWKTMDDGAGPGEVLCDPEAAVHKKPPNPAFVVT